MKKQTSVDWLHSALDELEMTKNKRSLVLHLDLRAELFQQAKSMEKEQHFELYKLGNSFLDSENLNFKDYFDQYYNETYVK